MKKRLKTLITKRLTDIILVIVVILIFLLTGKDNSSYPENEQNKPIESKFETVEKNNVMPDSVTPTRNTESESPSPPENNNTLPQTPIPVSKMFPKADAPIAPAENKLAESFKSLKPKEASQDDIVDRNAYFKSLSEQMNKLQGSASTDSEATNNPNSGDIANEDEELGDEEEDGDLDEIPIQIQEGTGDIAPNPYKDLNDKFPAPNIAE